MFSPIVRLEHSTLATLPLDASSGFEILSLDLGDATTRETVSDAPDADGVDDTTSFIGGRWVGMTVLLDAMSWTVRQQLRAYTHPRIRPTLFVQWDETAPEIQVTLRRGSFTDATPAEWVHSGILQIQAQWFAPTGVLESAELHEQTINASGETLGGRTYNLTFDRTYSAGDLIGSATVTNAGTADAYPLLRVYGPCTDPEIENVTQGKSIVFAGLTIAAGEFLEIDTREKTVRYQGDPAPSSSRYDKAVWPGFAWWTLSPGDNELVFSPATYTSPSQLVISFRDAWL